MARPGKSTWYVVADGSRAKILRWDRDGLVLVTEREAEVPPSRDIDADRPGRTFDSAGGHRHAMEPPTDAQRHRKRVFMRELAADLTAAAHDRAFETLVLVAAPSALGDLRDALPDPVRRRVVREEAKDLTPLGAKMLEAAIRDLPPPP